VFTKLKWKRVDEGMMMNSASYWRFVSYSVLATTIVCGMLSISALARPGLSDKPSFTKRVGRVTHTGHRSDGFVKKRSERRVKVVVTNPAGFSRESETVEINLSQIAKWLHVQPAEGEVAVVDSESGRILVSQIYSSQPGRPPDRFIFQVNLGPHERRVYFVIRASKLSTPPKFTTKTFARFVPERYDDFAWENDKIAFRMYGQALMTAPGDALTSSGIDVWVKRTHKLIVNEMYSSGHYHDVNGDAMDDYRVGTSRGDGGLGIWNGKKLFVSKNYHQWRIITNGPIRSVFELTYDSWNAGNGRTVSEVKRISIDAGSWLCKNVSIFESNKKGPLTVGVGLAERSCGPDGCEVIAQNKREGWMTYWQPEDKPKGIIGVAIVLPKGSVERFTNDNPNLPDSVIHAAVPQPTVEGAPPIRNLLAITKVKVGHPLTYYFGACWNKTGDFVNNAQWDDYVARFAERRDRPLKVRLIKE